MKLITRIRNYFRLRNLLTSYSYGSMLVILILAVIVCLVSLLVKYPDIEAIDIVFAVIFNVALGLLFYSAHHIILYNALCFYEILGYWRNERATLYRIAEHSAEDYREARAQLKQQIADLRKANTTDICDWHDYQDEIEDLTDRELRLDPRSFFHDRLYALTTAQTPH